MVLCLQGFGDALEATPLVEQLRRNVPDGEIVVVAMRPQVRDLYEALPALADRVIYVPYWERGLLRASGAFARLPFESRSEASFLAYPAARGEYAVLARAISSRVHYAHDYPRSSLANALGRRKIRRVTVQPKHNVLRNLDLLSAAGFSVSDPKGYVVPETWKSARAYPQRVVMHVGSIAHHGLEARRWPVESFVELGKIFESESIEIVLLSGPAERQESERVARALSDATIFTGDIPAVARMLAEAGAVVANDNGIAHLAAGVGTPVVALMGPTPREHGPYGKNAIAYRPSSCPPCFGIADTDARCALNIDYACLKRDIRAADVANTVSGLLGRLTEQTSHSLL